MTAILSGLLYEESSEPNPDAEVQFLTALHAEFPQYGHGMLRHFYQPWKLREMHRLYCNRCSTRMAEYECEIGAIHTKSLAHTLKLVSQRPEPLT